MNYKRFILLLGMGIVTASVSYGADDVTLPQAQNNYAAGPGAAVTNGNRAVAIGHLATAVDSGAVALGDAAKSTRNGVAIGRSAWSAYDNAIAVGDTAVSVENAVAMGNTARAYFKESLAIGHGSETNADFGVSLGTGANSKVKESVALGSDSIADREAESVGYDPSGDFVVKGPNNTLEVRKVSSPELAVKEAAYAILKQEVDALEATRAELTEKIKKAQDNYDNMLEPDTYNKLELNRMDLEEKKQQLSALRGEIDKTKAPWKSSKGAVSIGNPAGGETRQIIGLSAGIEDTDGVNVAQLKSLETAAYRAIDALRGEMRQGTAMSAALAALKPVQYKKDEPTQVMAGIGQYANKTGYALGVAHYTNERTMFNAGVALSGNKLIYNAGATLRFGKGSSNEKPYGSNASVAVLSEALEKVQRESQQTILQQGQAIKALQLENAQLRADVDLLKRMVLK